MKRAVSLATEREVAGLLAAILERSRETFHTPVDDSLLHSLWLSGRTQRPSGLIEAGKNPYRAWLFALRCERGLQSKWTRLRAGFFHCPRICVNAFRALPD